MSEQTTDRGDRSLLERALGVVTEVKAGEGPTALVLTFNIFLILTAYYVLKPVREGLLVGSGDNGAKYKSYMGAAIAIALLVVVPLYGLVADRVRKDKLVVGVTLFFASHLVGFYLVGKGFFAMDEGPARDKSILELALAFFLWIGVFNVMLVAQFWGFANHVYSQEQGKRLFPLVGTGASLGGVVGAYLTTALVPKGIPKAEGGQRTIELMLLSAVILCASAGLTFWSSRREQQRLAKSEAKKDEKKADEKKIESGTFSLVFKHKYLLYIALFAFVFTFENTNGEYMLSEVVNKAGKEAAAAGGDAHAYVTSFYGTFYLSVNIGVLVIQTFLASRIIKWGGLKLGFFIMPVVVVMEMIGIAVAPVLNVVRVGKIAENSVDYSINNTSLNMLWLPTSTEMKYKAKQAVDTFFVRFGDVASAGLVYLGAEMMHLGVRWFAIGNLVLAAIWLILGRAIVKKNEAMVKEHEPA